MMIRSHGWMFPVWCAVFAAIIGGLVAALSSKSDKDKKE